MIIMSIMGSVYSLKIDSKKKEGFSMESNQKKLVVKLLKILFFFVYIIIFTSIGNRVLSLNSGISVLVVSIFVLVVSVFLSEVTVNKIADILGTN